MSAPSPTVRLHQLFIELFSLEELRRFLSFHGPSIAYHLPDRSVSMAEFAFAAVQVLQRHGAVDVDLFDALRQQFPRRIPAIDAVAQEFGLASANEAAVASPPLPSRPYAGPTPRYRSAEVEAMSQRLLALYHASERRADRRWTREIDELHRSLRGKFGELQPGELLTGGRYLLIDERPRSSTPGVVWHAYDLTLEREVALRLFTGGSKDTTHREHIREVAHAMARVQHPNIAAVLDPRVVDEPYYGYTTEFLRGGRLGDRLERLHGDTPAVIELVVKLAAALAFAHERGMVHGALEIWSVDFGDDGEPRLRDIGLLALEAETRYSRRLLPFLAPELLAGSEPSPAADQYALARICVACLLGKEYPPSAPGFDRSLVRVGVRAELRGALLRAHYEDPKKRFPSVEAFAEALRAGQEARPKSVQAAQPAPVLRSAGRNATTMGNPFSAGKPLDGAMPPGRDEDIDRVLSLVADRGSALLLGPRRPGKTSLLRNLQRSLAMEHPIASVSLEGAACDTPDALAAAFAPDLQAIPGAARAFVKRLKQEERWPVLMIDELGYLRNANVHITPSVFSWLRSLSQESASVIYAGSQSDWNQVIAVAKQQPGSSFGNDIVVHDLGPLSREAALSFLERTAPPDVPIPADPVGGWILDLCGTWPFYLQVMGYSVVDVVRRTGDRRPLADREALRELYEGRLIRERSHVFEGRWEELGPRVRELVLRERDALPEFSALPLADKKSLGDAGMFSALRGGWLLHRDPPFHDWIRRKYDELKES